MQIAKVLIMAAVNLCAGILHADARGKRHILQGWGISGVSARGSYGPKSGALTYSSSAVSGDFQPAANHGFGSVGGSFGQNTTDSGGNAMRYITR